MKPSGALGAAGMSALGGGSALAPPSSAPGTSGMARDTSSSSAGPLAALGNAVNAGQGGAGGNADSTFITRARSQLNKNSSSSNEEPLGLDRVRNLHNQLTNVVGSLNDKVSTILKKQESEFLRAYRAHMYSVQKELAQLRAKADDAALQLAKNEKIRQLEAERDWYRSEALRLDAFCSSLKADVEYMRDKVAALEEDRSWLEKQLKSSKKTRGAAAAAGGVGHHHPMLNATHEGGSAATILDASAFGSGASTDEEGDESGNDNGGGMVAGSEAGAGGSGGMAGSSSAEGMGMGSRAGSAGPAGPGSVASSAGGAGGTGRGKWSLGPKLRKPEGAASSKATGLFATLGATTGGGGATASAGDVALAAKAAFALQPLQGQQQQQSSKAALELAAHAQQQVKRLEAQLANATKQLDSTKQRNSKLKAANTALRTSRGELETFFLQCVEDVRKEVARRRVRNVVTSTPAATAMGGALTGTGSGAPGGGGHASDVEHQLTSMGGVETAVALARARQVTLGDFTGGDRRAVVSRLLQDEFVLQALHDVIFQSNGAGSAGGGPQQQQQHHMMLEDGSSAGGGGAGGGR